MAAKARRKKSDIDQEERTERKTLSEQIAALREAYWKKCRDRRKEREQADE